MSASVSGPEPRDGSFHASTGRLIAAVVIAATLLIASFATSPARGQDAGQPPDPAGAGGAPPPPPPVPPAPPAPTSGSRSAPAVASPPAVPAVPPPAQRSGGRASQPASDANESVPKPSGGGSYVYSTDGVTTKVDVPAEGARRGKNAPESPAAGANSDSLRGQKRYADDRPARSAGRGSAPRRRANAKISPRGAAPGFGSQLPGRNPSVSLLRSTGGAAGLALAGVLAILGVAVVLRRDRWTIFRVPTVTWRPLAYVPPIDLPG